MGDISSQIEEIQTKLPAESGASVTSVSCEAMRNHMSVMIAESCQRFDDRIREISGRIDEIQKRLRQGHGASIAAPGPEEVSKQWRCLAAGCVGWKYLKSVREKGSPVQRRRTDRRHVFVETLPRAQAWFVQSFGRFDRGSLFSGRTRS